MENHVESVMGGIHAEEYKRRAADCMREAGSVSDDKLREAYFQMARLWKKMADKASSCTHGGVPSCEETATKQMP
jgi:hypothetical protein